jgi:D-arabinose 1-dehydrogenase-like Zn-dependent alcohol dehydrogenase
MCLIDREVTGFNFDGGYAEYMIARAGTLASIPDFPAGTRRRGLRRHDEW